MNVDDKVEVDCILEQADILLPDSSPELFRAVRLSPYMLHVQGGWHPKRGAVAECRSKETLSRGPLHVVHVAIGMDVKRCHVKLFIISNYSLDG